MSNDPLIELTSYDTGNPIYIRLRACTIIRDLEAKTRHQHSHNLPSQDLLRRTQIDTDKDFLIVTESAETVRALFKQAERPDVVPSSTEIFWAEDGSGFTTAAGRDSHDKLTEPKVVTSNPYHLGPSTGPLESALARILVIAKKQACLNYSATQTVQRFCREGLAAAWGCSPSEVGTPDLSKLSP